MLPSELVHFDELGWCILSRIDENQSRFHFFTLEFSGNDPTHFATPKFKTSQPPKEKCSVRYSTIEDYAAFNEGMIVFYYENEKRRTGRHGMGQVRYGKITLINHDTENIVLDKAETIKMCSVMVFEHNYQQVKDRDLFICRRCHALLEGNNHDQQTA